ncbi:MAG: helix-turn-helix domain-containing protein [Salibacteraceae bacterium]
MQALKVVPAAFYTNPAIQKILVDDPCCILGKTVDQVSENQERYLSAHAITLVTQGTLRVETEEGLVQRIPAGNLVLLPKGLYFVSDVLPAKGSCKATVFFFDDALIDQFLGATLQAHSPGTTTALFTLTTSEMVATYVENLHRLYNHSSASRSPLTRPKLLELFYLLLEAPQGQEMRHRLCQLSTRHRRPVRELMEAQYNKPLSIADYAYLYGRSITTFQRDFKRHFGLSPKQWLIQKRMAKARELALQSQLSIPEMAASVGYGNTSHFIQAFRKQFGNSPLQFRLQHGSAPLSGGVF